MVQILDRNFKKIDVLKHYTFWQYEIKFRDIGEFQINLRVNENNIYLLNREEIYYVLFDDKILGKVENVKKDSDSEYVRIATLSGRLIPYIFTKRVIARILDYDGDTINFVKTLIQNEITNNTSSNRYIPISVVFENESYLQEKTTKYKKQITGGYVWDEIKLALDKDKLGIFFEPIVKTEHTYNGVQTNISEWELRISAGADRRKGNEEGNTPVILSQSLSNINRTEYEHSLKDNCNVVYVAGEGEGTDRKWYEIKRNNVTKKGWEREEYFSDARDIQSELSDGTSMSTSEYEELISERAEEAFVENDIKESYNATLTEINIKYKYNKDYFLGDFVTIQDDEIGVTIDAQIVSYIKSEEGSMIYEDIGVEYGKILTDPIKKIKNIDNKTKQNESDIKYLEVKMKKIEKQSEKSSYPIGSIIITNTKTNPSSSLGGTWTLVDKNLMYKQYISSDVSGLITSGSNISDITATITTRGNVIAFDFNFKFNVDIGETNREVCTVNFSKIGISRFANTVYSIGGSDAGDAVTYCGLGYSSGTLNVYDIVPKEDSGLIASGSAINVGFIVPISMSYMLDDFCDKFYWKRTA